MNAYSISQWVNDTYLAKNPEHIFTMVCDCSKCANKKFVKIRTAQLPELAIKAGFSDMITAKQLQELMHKVVQKAG